MLKDAFCTVPLAESVLFPHYVHSGEAVTCRGGEEVTKSKYSCEKVLVTRENWDVHAQAKKKNLTRFLG